MVALPVKATGAFMTSRITKRTVDAAKPGSTQWDGELPGFGLRTTKLGTKTYVLKYRSNGTQRWYTIGQHGRPASTGGVWTPTSARNEAIRVLGLVKAGQDPATERREDREAETVRDFAERYKADHVDVHTKPRSAEETHRLIDKTIVPSLGHIRVKDLKRSHVVSLHRELRETPYKANRALAAISHMLTKAEEWGVRDDGARLCRTIQKYKERKRERFLSPSELQALGSALEQAERDGTNSSAIGIIRLLLFTGARRNEIESLTWSEIDWERNSLRLTDSKTGAKQIALAPAARDVLSRMPQLDGSPFVFPASTGGGHFQGIGKIWRQIRMRAGLSDVRLHDLRHTFASFGAAGGLSLPLIGALLGHSQPQTTQRYAHLADDPIQQAAKQVGDAVASAMSGSSAEVHQMLKPSGGT